MSLLSGDNLELAKLAISVLTPVFVLVLGIVINNSIKNSERSTSLRSEIYRTVGGDLNDIYSYLSFVGGWKELTPIDITARKRTVDRAMFTYKPFFSDELFNTYKQFMTEAFSHYEGAGVDARIRSSIATPNGNRRIHGTNPWQSEWDDRFTNEKNTDAQRKAYEMFLIQLARDLKL